MISHQVSFCLFYSSPSPKSLKGISESLGIYNLSLKPSTDCMATTEKRKAVEIGLEILLVQPLMELHAI